MFREIAVKLRIDMSLFVFLIDIQLYHIDPFCDRYLFSAAVAVFHKNTLLEALHFVPAVRWLRILFHLYIFIYYTS